MSARNRATKRPRIGKQIFVRGLAYKVSSSRSGKKKNLQYNAWTGKEWLAKFRPQPEGKSAENASDNDLIHKATDQSRVKKPEWLVVIGVCTHLGCVPLGQKIGDNKGDYGGWFCPCHGSHYDTSGRIRKGPAPLNLEVPPYDFIAEDIIKIG